MSDILPAGGYVYLVGAGPGDPGLATVRAVWCIEHADVVVYDRLVNPALLSYARHAELVDVGKEPEHHRVPQERINHLLLERARLGQRVVRLKGGDPFVFGRGGEEAALLAEAGIPFEIVPGVSSALAAPAYAGIPVTHREMACSVAIATGHRAAGGPDPACDWRRVAAGADTLVFLMGVHNLAAIVHELLAQGRGVETPVALISHATCTDQRTVTGTLGNIVARAAGITPPAVIVTGDVAALGAELRWFDCAERRPLLGWRVLTTARPGRPGELGQTLAGLGAEALDLRVTEIRPAAAGGPLDQALARLLGRTRPYEAVAFADATSVEYTLERLAAVGGDVRALAGVCLHAWDGPAAAALRRRGLVPDATGPALENPGGRTLVPGPALAFDSPARSWPLVHVPAGWTIERVPAYTIHARPPLPAAQQVLVEGRARAIVLGHPADPACLAAALGRRDVAALLAPMQVVCADAGTAQAAAQWEIRVDRVASGPSVDDVTRCILTLR